MREIKFRGKDYSGQWCIGDLTTWRNGTSRIRIVGTSEVNGTVSASYHEVVPETVGQFTGLCDCKGHEIYEGDLIDDGGERKCEVYWMDDLASFMFEDVKDQNPWHFSPDDVLIVVGNIYDNPELLKP